MLAPELDRALAAALNAELAKVEADAAAAFDGPSRSSARAGRLLFEVHVTRAAKVRASGDGLAYAALLRDIGEEVALPSEVLAAAERLTVTGAAREVGGGMARDAAQLAADTGKGWMALLKASPLVLVGLLVLAVVLFVRRLPVPSTPGGRS